MSGIAACVADQLRRFDDGRSDFNQVAAMRVIGRRIGEHQFDEAEDDHEMVAQAMNRRRP